VSCTIEIYAPSFPLGTFVDPVSLSQGLRIIMADENWENIEASI